MAKRKQARSGSRKRTAGRKARPAAGRKRTPARRTTGKAARRTLPRRSRRPGTAGTGRKKASSSRKSAATARKTPAARRKTAGAAGRRGPEPIRTPTKKSTPPRSALGKRGPGSHRLQIERDRRILEESVPGPPSSLDVERYASAARTGRAEMQQARSEHTEASPRLTGGDVDADWENAYSTGDEAPGGDMPTPDQDVVEEIGASLGVQYNDDEELKSVDKIADRDRHRWELDPASSDDYRDRTKREGR